MDDRRCDTGQYAVEKPVHSHTIEDMQNKAEIVEITTAGIRESHVHDVQITKEASNYRAD